MIRLLNGQLDRADKRISALTTTPRTIRNARPPSPPSETNIEPPETPVLEDEEFSTHSVEGSPRSLVSLESSIRRGSDESERESFEMEIDEEKTTISESVEDLNVVRVPFKLEHDPKRTRKESILDQLSPRQITAHRTPFYTERAASQVQAEPYSSPIASSAQSQAPSNQHAKVATPAVSRVHMMSRGKLPPTPDDTPVTQKVRPRRSSTLRSRIFRTKSDVSTSEQQPVKEPAKTVSKKTSFINFWKPKASAMQTKETRPSIEEDKVSPAPEKSGNAVRNHDHPPRIALPHQSDKFSRYPKVRPVSMVTTSSTTTSTPKEWRHSIGRQVSEMVQHWEDESRRTDTRSVSTSSKRSTVADISSLAVKAARDAWAAKTSTPSSITGKTGVERGDKWKRSRDGLVRKLGLSTIPPNAAAA